MSRPVFSLLVLVVSLSSLSGSPGSVSALSAYPVDLALEAKQRTRERYQQLLDHRLQEAGLSGGRQRSPFLTRGAITLPPGGFVITGGVEYVEALYTVATDGTVTEVASGYPIVVPIGVAVNLFTREIVEADVLDVNAVSLEHGASAL